MGNNIARLAVQMNIKKCFFSLILFFVYLSAGYPSNDASANSNSKIYSRNNLQREAKMMAESGQLEEAVTLYKKSMLPEYLSSESDKGLSINALKEIYKWQNKFEESKQMALWFLKINPTSTDNKDQVMEIQSLESYSKDGNSKPIYDFIRHIKNTKSTELPPAGYFSYSTIVVSDILRLYDTIGDYDAGIKFIDEITDYFYTKDPDFKGIAKVQSTEEIGDKYLWKPRKLIDKHWREYKVLREHLLVREAFLQDKAEGKKGSMKEGKPGRATLALIQSDYFPW